MKILIGADPELFVKDSRTGKFVCAHGLVQGTKERPQPVLHGAVQVDGMALEFNIDPAQNCNEFIANIWFVRQQMQAMIDPNYVLEPVATAWFDADYFAECPAEAKLLGCNPDYNAWTGAQNDKPETDQPFRTGAGHLHGGWREGADITDPEVREEAFMVIRQLDCCVGAFSPLWDGDIERRKLYGAAGSCRVKTYGAEYRPLSNAWLANEDTTRWVYGQTYMAIEALSKGRDYTKDWGEFAQEIINSPVQIPVKQLYNRLAKTPMSAINGMPPVLRAA